MRSTWSRLTICDRCARRNGGFGAAIPILMSTVEAGCSSRTRFCTARLTSSASYHRVARLIRTSGAKAASCRISELVALPGAEFNLEARHLSACGFHIGACGFRLEPELLAQAARRQLLALDFRLQVPIARHGRVPGFHHALLLLAPCLALVHERPLTSDATEPTRQVPGRASLTALEVKKARLSGLFFIAPSRSRDRPDVARLLAFGTGRHVEGHLLILLERLEAAVLDRREMREEILAAAIRRDEAITFCIVEPLDRACCHLCHS